MIQSLRLFLSLELLGGYVDSKHLTALAIARINYERECMPKVTKQERLQILASELMLEMESQGREDFKFLCGDKKLMVIYRGGS